MAFLSAQFVNRVREVSHGQPQLLSCIISASPRAVQTRLVHSKWEPERWAHSYVDKLSPAERSALRAALRDRHLQEHSGVVVADSPSASQPAASNRAEAPPPPPSDDDAVHTPVPTREQLRQTLIFNGLPFIGFGFLDNAIMIMAGEYIDITLGAALAISTMAAAAIGNLISDVAGLGLAGWVETLGARIGAAAPDLTPRQLALPYTRLVIGVARVLGVAFGCILGMFPLLFYCDKKEDADEEGLEKDVLVSLATK